MAIRTSTVAVTRPPGRFDDFIGTVAPITHTAFRIGVALLFMQHGAQKLFGWMGGMDGEGGTAEITTMMGVAGLLEFFGGFLVLIGLLTRPVALLLVVEMVAAYVIAHVPQGWIPIQNQGELALMYALSFAFLFGLGAGPLSVDAAITRRREASGIGAATGRPGTDLGSRTEIAIEQKERKRGTAA